MNTLVLILILLVSVNSFGQIAKFPASNNISKFEAETMITNEYIARIERIDMAKDLKNLMNQKKKKLTLIFSRKTYHIVGPLDEVN